MTLSLTPVRTVAPVGTPITVAEAKTQMGVTKDDDDAFILALIQACTARYEGWRGILGGVAFVTQTWRTDLDAFVDLFRLPLVPVQSVTVAYSDAANAAQVLAGSNYTIFNDALGQYLSLLSGSTWPSTYVRSDAVRVTLVAGFGTAAQWAAVSNPEMAPIKQALGMMVQKLYFQAKRDGGIDRETIEGVGSWGWSPAMAASLDEAAEYLLSPYQRMLL